MITPFEVYLILQLDNINAILLAVSLIGIASSILLFVVFYRENDNEYNNNTKKYLSVFILLFVLTAFIPSTKTAAAMFLIPKLTSVEVIAPMSSELKELYNLTKDAIKKIAEE